MRDAGASEVLGTALLLGITVTLVAVAGGHYLQPRSEEIVPDLDVAVRLRTGEAVLRVLHAGGDAVDRGATHAVVKVGGVLASDAALGATGTLWRSGQDVTVNLPSPPAAGALVEVSLTMPDRGITLARSELRVPSTSVAAPITFTVTGRLESAFDPVRTPGVIVVVAEVSHSGGRGAVRTVVVDLSAVNGSATHVLRDDGLGGDAAPGDGVWSAAADIRPNAPYGKSNLTLRATDVAGTTATAKVSIEWTLGPQQYYKAAIYRKVGHKVTKLGSPGAQGGGDHVRVDIKFDLQEEPMTVDGESYSLKRVLVIYDPLKSGNKDPLSLTKNCQGSDPRLQSWSIASGPIRGYVHNRDLLRYYLAFEWETSNKKVHRELVEGSELSSYFLMRENEPHKEVLDRGWPTSLTNCAP